MNEFDVIIIGAGAAGMMAALEIALTGKTVAVLEAKDVCGGRMKTTYTKGGHVVELGAEFVHGKLPVTLHLLEKAGIKKQEVTGSFWQKKDGRLQKQKEFIQDYETLEKKLKALKNDISVATFINEHLQEDKYEGLRFTLQNYVEGYYAADIKKASALAMYEELTEGDDVNYRMEGGYQPLVDYLEKVCKEKGVRFFLSQPVLQLHWKKAEVEAVTSTTSYKAKKVLVTVSVGVLQSDAVRFQPSLPEKIAAAKGLGFGHVTKVNIELEDRFWTSKELTEGNDLSDMSFLFSEEAVPTWWTKYPQKDPVIIGWLGGPKGKAMQLEDDETVKKKTVSSLSRIFGIDVIRLQQKISSTKFYNWTADPYFCGAYSYAVVNGNELMQTVLQPVEDTIYFAGEGLHSGTDIGTVEAALASGRDVAHKLIASF